MVEKSPVFPHLPKPLSELVEAGWAEALSPVAADIAKIGETLRERTAAGERYLPSGENVLRAFTYPFQDVRVLIVGQDPYTTPGHSIGIAFAVDRGVHPLPKSLQNIYKELESDLGIPAPKHGDLRAWSESGVMLLNRVLTVKAGSSGSHQGLGWEKVTETAIRALASRDKPLVAILWGNQARATKEFLKDAAIIESVHPSPLSAHRGFFGSKPFSRANELLISQGGKPINWQI